MMEKLFAKNPWEEIPLSDYEKHMSLDSVMQLQAMSEMMKAQFAAYPVSRVMIFGVAGGNGLEHIRHGAFEKIYGIDINASYLRVVAQRHPALGGALECLRIDLTSETEKLPQADLVIANLLVEYIGYECFQKAIRQARAKYVSCIIQVNAADGWVSDSPYLHAFDGLERVHRQIEADALADAMREIGYRPIKTAERVLPNGKKLVRIDFCNDK